MNPATKCARRSSKLLARTAAAAGTASRNVSSKHPDSFVSRHIGPNEAETQKMLQALGLKSLDELVAKTVPQKILLEKDLELSEPLSETELLERATEIADENEQFNSYIGMGYNNTITPPVILRNVIENPGWTTPYTPYQPEISQGRLTGLLNYQTMVQDLTGLPVANASLLDEGTAAGEALGIAIKLYPKKKAFFIDEKCHPQTIAIVKTRADAFGVATVIGAAAEADVESGRYCGVLFQYPDTDGSVRDFKSLVQKCSKAKTMSICATDLLALTLLAPPGEWGCDVALGNSQRFGVPLGYGGPHAAFFACRQDHVRRLPGRLIGVSVDANNKRALRLTLTTREQHIRRDKATSNICTAQALLANVAAMYAIYHGPQGLNKIATMVHSYTCALAKGAEKAGFKVRNEVYFDTVRIDVGNKKDQVLANAKKHRINLRNFDDTSVGVSLDETVTQSDLEALLKVFECPISASDAWEAAAAVECGRSSDVIGSFGRKGEILPHSVFNSYHSETKFTRYLKMLENLDSSLVHSMTPLGSCTMKLNATAEMIPITYAGLNSLHPFVPVEQARGYRRLFDELEGDLQNITGFHTVHLQPNSGSQGEYTGLRVIDAYHRARNESNRNVCVIPRSAHGTNPASAQMAGLRVVPLDVDPQGSVTVQEVKKAADKYKGNLSSIMLTYPSTFGVFEEQIKEVADVVHHYGAQLYMDGANMNALVGLCRPAEIGADVIHLNLHKTFCIPHGGGGPGVGPIGVKEHLAPFLPTHPVIMNYEVAKQSFGAIAAAPWGSSSILPISWAFIKMMGAQGLKKATQIAILSANYMRQQLQDDYDVLYVGKHGFCAHEFILDVRPLKRTAGIEANDIAKRLMDFGFHAPTMSWPVPNTLMIEPTESEDLSEIDRYITALKTIRSEIRDIEQGRIAYEDSPLKHAPHPVEVICGDSWDRKYSRTTGAFPAPFVKPGNKRWPAVGRLNDPYGDLNLNCSCDPVDF